MRKIEQASSAAEGALRDDVGKKSVERTEEFCSKMKNILRDGKERAKALENKYQKELDEMNRLKGLASRRR